jgi:hypothetical protein
MPVADPPSAGKPYVPSPEQQQETGPSVRAAIVKSTSRQYGESCNCSTAIMTEFNAAVSDENKIVAITKIVLNLMKQNGH